MTGFMRPFANARVAGAAFYAIAAIITFGHSAAGKQAWNDAHCGTAKQRLEQGTDCYVGAPGPAVLAGFLWPLYWSWEAWS